VPLYPLVPLVFVVGTAVGLGTIVWGEWTNGNKSPVFGLGIAALGIPFYLFVRKKRDAVPARACFQTRAASKGLAVKMNGEWLAECLPSPPRSGGEGKGEGAAAPKCESPHPYPLPPSAG
jgi:hypothetical protein